MDYQEKKADQLAVRLYKAAAAYGAVLGGAYGVANDLSPHASAFKDALSGGSLGFLFGGTLGTVFTYYCVEEDDPIVRPRVYENSVDACIDSIVELVIADRS